MLTTLRDGIPQIDGSAKIQDYWLKDMALVITKSIGIYVLAMRNSERTDAEVAVDLKDLLDMLKWWDDDPDIAIDTEFGERIAEPGPIQLPDTYEM